MEIVHIFLMLRRWVEVDVIKEEITWKKVENK